MKAEENYGRVFHNFHNSLPRSLLQNTFLRKLYFNSTFTLEKKSVFGNEKHIAVAASQLAK